MLERRPQPARVRAEVGVVGDHHADVDGQLTAAPAPEQVEQAVVLARDHDRDALGRLGVGHPPLHAQWVADRRGERGRQLGPALPQARQVELHAQEEAPGVVVGRVLVGLRDVRALLEEEARHRRDDPRPVRADGDQTPHVGAVVHPGASVASSQRPTVA